jgi:hypothetical protein
VKPDGRFKELGLTIYLSKDKLLNCEETDSTEPFCDISFNPPQLKLEPAFSCE